MVQLLPVRGIAIRQVCVRRRNTARRPRVSGLVLVGSVLTPFPTTLMECAQPADFFWQIGDVGRALKECEALRGRHLVRVVEVSVDLADEDATVLVSGPLRALLSITAQKAGT